MSFVQQRLDFSINSLVLDNIRHLRFKSYFHLDIYTCMQTSSAVLVVTRSNSEGIPAEDVCIQLKALQGRTF
jgi:hypothetical protein